MSVIKFGALFFALNFLFLKSSFAQSKKIDSLNLVLKTAKEDTNKVNTLIDLSATLDKTNMDTALIVARQSLELAKKIGSAKSIAQTEHLVGALLTKIGDYDEGNVHMQKAVAAWDELIYSADKAMLNYSKRGKARSLDLVGVLYGRTSDNNRAISYIFKAWQLYKEVDSKTGMSRTLGHLGNIYLSQGDFSKAIDYYYKALKIDEGSGNKNGAAGLLNNIASTYLIQNQYDKALELYLKALKLNEEIHDISGIAECNANLGAIYDHQGKYDKAFEAYTSALKVSEQIGAKQMSATIMANMADLFIHQNKKSTALDYYQRSLALNEESGDKGAISRDVGNIGALYLTTGKFAEAEKFLLRAIELSTSVNALEELKLDEQRISRLYDTLGKTALAYEHYKKFIKTRNAIYSGEQQKQQVRSEMNYEFDKKEIAAKAEQDKKNAIEKQEKQKRKMFLYFVLIGLSVLVVFAIILFQRYRLAQKQKQIIEHQKHLVEEHQQEILDSITYAKRLQEAILPPLEVIKKYLPESFVLYKPKSIVAGDFYWMEMISQQSLVSSQQSDQQLPTADLVLIAAADCTGHGVPGAMVSVVCSNALNRAVKEFKLTEPGKILDKTRELVVETFEKSTSEVKDGMDISLLCIDRRNKKIFWSGANNPLWYLDEVVSSSEVENKAMKEIKADKQPIGKADHAKPFTTHEIDYKKDSVFYLFTDGYADQFGGPKGKKFKYKQLSVLLENNMHLTLQQQSELINKEFEDWRGNLEQVDDVCVIGIKI